MSCYYNQPHKVILKVMVPNRQQNSRLGLVRCEHCGRQFNPHSAARHIPWCAKQQADGRRPKLSIEKREAFERYKWRINYRPSNQLNQLNPITRSRFFKPLKSSSITSSPSASSSNSARTSIASSLAPNESQPDPTIGLSVKSNQRTKFRAKEPVQNAAIKRSVSSLTLVKKRGIVSSPRPDNQSDKFQINRANRSNSTLNRVRTKSVNDLNDMNQVVEILAQRMDEIYVQNLRLLENLAAGQTGNRNPNAPVRCHHCKTSLQNGANYCHRCGCKTGLSPSSDEEAISRGSPISTPESHQTLASN